MRIGIISDPLNHPDWPQIRKFLVPAAERGNVPVLEANEAVWAVYAPELIGAATARLTYDDWGEIILSGGVEAKLWAVPLSDRISDWMRDEGMNAVRIYGRKGWARLLSDWQVIGSRNGMTAYERLLA